MNLLKASAKKINPNKRRKIIPLMGTIKDYHVAVENESSIHQSQQNQNNPNENFTILNQNEVDSDGMQ